MRYPGRSNGHWSEAEIRPAYRALGSEQCYDGCHSTIIAARLKRHSYTGHYHQIYHGLAKSCQPDHVWSSHIRYLNFNVWYPHSSYLLERLDALRQALEIDSTNSAKGIEHLAIHSQTTRPLEKPLFSRRRSCRLSHPDCFFPAYPASPEGLIVLRLHTPTWNRPIFMTARINLMPRFL